MSKEQPSAEQPTEFYLGPFACRPLLNTVTDSRGETWSLKPKTMDLLVFLAENRGRVVSKDEIFEAVWTDTFVGDGVLWKSISELRQTLGDDSKNPRIIVTIPKRGYRLDLPADIPEEQNPVEPTARSTTSSPGQPWRLSWKPVAAVFVAVVLGTAGWFVLWRSSEEKASPSIGQRPIILVGQFDNRTGESVFEGTLEYAMQNDLLASELVRVASKTRVEETLNRMGRPADTPLDESVSREVSLRDGEIVAIVVGSIAKLAGNYELGVRLLDPRSGEVLRVSTERTDRPNQLLDFVGEMADDIVGRVLSLKGLPPSPMSDRKVWTRSVEAFQSYLQGIDSYRLGQYGEAEILFRRAVGIDPEFASAHLMLGWSYRYQGRQAEANEQGKRAAALLDRVTPAEKAFIEGTCHYWLEEYEEAWGHFELLLELEPDHPWALMILTTVAKRLGRLDRLTETIVKTAATNPKLLSVQEGGAGKLVEIVGRVDLARPLVQRAREITAESPTQWGSESGWRGAWIQSFGVWERWLEGDIEGALSEAERVRIWLEGKRSNNLSPQRHANFLALQYLTLGRVKDALELIKDFGAAPGLYSTEMLALSSASFDDELMDLLGQSPPSVVRSLLGLLLRPSLVGSTGDPVKLVAPDQPQEGPIFEAETAIADGRMEVAVEHLQRARQMIFEGRVIAPGYLNYAVPYAARQALVLLEIARLEEASGRTSKAVRVLEELSSMRAQSYPATAIVWLFGRAYLADLYRQAGRAEEANSIEAELKKLLAYADPDHPLKVKLSR